MVTTVPQDEHSPIRNFFYLGVPSFGVFKTQVDVLLGINKDDGTETVMEGALAEAPKVMAARVARRDQELKVLAHQAD